MLWIQKLRSELGWAVRQLVGMVRDLIRQKLCRQSYAEQPG